MKGSPRPSVCAALLAAFLAGCVATQAPKAVLNVGPGESPSFHTVAVVADPYMQDCELADRVREATRQQFLDCGYDVKNAEAEAEIVVVATLSISGSASSQALTSAVPRLGRPRPRMFASSPRNPSEEESRMPVWSVTAAEPERMVLVVKAYRKSDWFDPNFIDAPMPQVWAMTASLPRRKGEESVQIFELATACGKALERFSGKAQGSDLSSSRSTQPPERL